MKKIIFIFSILVSSLAYGQEDVPNDLFGVWQNNDGEAVRISRVLDQVVFERRGNGEILSRGTIQMVEGELHIVRADCDDEYNLAFFIGNETLVISKPRSVQAWLWDRIQ